MTAIRSLFAQRHLAVLLCAAALLLKLIVPAGYMIGQVDGHATMMRCPGGGTISMAASHGGVHHQTAQAAHRRHPSGHSEGGHGHDMPCAFAGLAAPGLAAADPVQPSVPIAFVMAVGIAAIAPPRTRATPRLRPPLRGPPARS